MLKKWFWSVGVMVELLRAYHAGMASDGRAFFIHVWSLAWSWVCIPARAMAVMLLKVSAPLGNWSVTDAHSCRMTLKVLNMSCCCCTNTFSSLESPMLENLGNKTPVATWMLVMLLWINQ